MKENTILQKSFRFAVRITNLSRYLQKEKSEYVLSKQILRSGTSIGANVTEAQRAQSKADFLSKLSIALKEADETKYWLNVLYQTHYLNSQEFRSIYKDIREISALLTAICMKLKSTPKSI